MLFHTTVYHSFALLKGLNRWLWQPAGLFRSEHISCSVCCVPTLTVAWSQLCPELLRCVKMHPKQSIGGTVVLVTLIICSSVAVLNPAQKIMIFWPRIQIKLSYHEFVIEGFYNYYNYRITRWGSPKVQRVLNRLQTAAGFMKPKLTDSDKCIQMPCLWTIRGFYHRALGWISTRSNSN